MNKKTDHYLNLARKEAFKSTHHKTRIGAVIVNKGKIVAKGYNKLQYSRLAKSKWIGTVHAEIDAILNAPKRLLSRSSIYVYRIKKNGESGLAKPCSNCMTIIEFKKIKHVIYSDVRDTFKII